MRGALSTGYVTPCELEIWRSVALGMQNREIAAALGVSTKTVEKHRTCLCRKLDVHSAVEVVRVAIERGVIAVQVRPLRSVVVKGYTRHLL